MTLSNADLIGAWALVDFVVTFDDGRPPLEPFGPGTQGQIIYSEDGHMSAVLSSGSREAFGIAQLEQSGRATDGEKATAFDSYMSYCGRYRVEGDRVVHTVELGLMPNIVGREQVRDASLSDGVLTLAYDVTTPRGERRFTLRWKRS